MFATGGEESLSALFVGPKTGYLVDMIGFWFPYWWLVIPAILLTLFAQARVQGTFRKYKDVRVRSGMTGADVARRILDTYELRQIPVKSVQGQLTDHYDPRSKTVRLSEAVIRDDSVAAVGVAAHETGHAIQHAQRYTPLNLRNTIYPVASFGSSLGPILVIGGLIFGSVDILINAGIILFSAAVAFSVLTLPVEFNASARAIRILRTSGSLTERELDGAKSVLNAAALTYVASTLTAVLTLLRLVLLSRRS